MKNPNCEAGVVLTPAVKVLAYADTAKELEHNLVITRDLAIRALGLELDIRLKAIDMVIEEGRFKVATFNN